MVVILRRLLPYCIIYLCLFVLYYFNSQTGTVFKEREFTKKELSDGPLVIKDPFSDGKKNIIYSNVLLNANLLFDQPIAHESQVTIENATLPELSPLFVSKLLQLGTTLSSNGSDFLYLTLVNQAFEGLLLNWMCNTDHFKTVHQRLLIVTLSEEICINVNREWKEVNCLHLSTNGYDNSAEWGSQTYINMLTIRMEIMKTLNQASIPFVLVEADSIWFRDPWILFKNQTLYEKADIVVPIKGFKEKWDKLSFDPMVVLPTTGSRTLLEEISKRLLNDSSLYDQAAPKQKNSANSSPPVRFPADSGPRNATGVYASLDQKVSRACFYEDILNELCQSQFNGVICRTFNWEDIGDGKWFKLSDREREDFNPYIVNNNYYVGVQNKESRQAINGMWFLTKKKHCLISKVERFIQKYSREN